MGRYNRRRNDSGSWFRHAGVEMETACGHSFATCHTNKCFVKEEEMKRNGEVVKLKDLHKGDIVTAVRLDGTRTVENVTVRYVGSSGFDHSRGDSVNNADRDWIVIKHPKVPDNYPPVRGDVWEADGAFWYYTLTNGEYLVPVVDSKSQYRLGRNAEQLLEYSDLTLRFRPGVTVTINGSQK